MPTIAIRTAPVILFMAAVGALFAQQGQPAPVVPRLVRVTNTFHPANGLPTSVESVTLSIYSEEHEGAPLWSETQNVNVDAEGRYNVVMGSTRAEGVSTELFVTDEPRWLGVTFNRPGEREQPRMLLVSVPYALKAVDSETLGGRPASAYLLAPAGASAGDAAPGALGDSHGSLPASLERKSLTPLVTSGATNCIGVFTNSTDLGCSVMRQSGNNIGVGTTTPGATLDVIGQAAVGTGGSTQTYGFDLYVNAANPRVLVDSYGNPGTASVILQGRNGSIGISHQLSVNASGLFSIAPGSTGAPALSVVQNGNVGFGTTAPASKVDVNGAITIDPGCHPGFVPGSLNVDVCGSVARIQPWGSVNLALNPYAGNVGIGTATPGSKLDVVGDINLSGMLRFQGFSGLQVGITNGVTAIGSSALGLNITGTNNTAIGFNTLAFNTTGNQNTAGGAYALFSNANGSFNTAHGYGALQSNTSGSLNTAAGYSALASAVGATNNTASGAWALSADVNGQDNTATGFSALKSTTSGGQNTASGSSALFSNITGNNNTATGFNALYNSTGSNNVGIGYQAGYFVSTGNNNIHIGSQGFSSDSAIIRIGTPGTQTKFFAAGVAGANVSGAAVLVDTSTGQLGVASSSRRFKDDIHDMGDASRGLMRLRPVTFRYKQPFADGSKPMQYGLIAEEVSEVFPDLVAHSADGRIETVKYQVLDSMLLNEVQRQQAEISAQKEQIRDLRERLEKLEAALTAAIPAH